MGPYSIALGILRLFNLGAKPTYMLTTKKISVSLHTHGILLLWRHLHSPRVSLLRAYEYASLLIFPSFVILTLLCTRKKKL